MEARPFATPILVLSIHRRGVASASTLLPRWSWCRVEAVVLCERVSSLEWLATAICVPSARSSRCKSDRCSVVDFVGADKFDGVRDVSGGDLTLFLVFCLQKGAASHGLRRR